MRASGRIAAHGPAADVPLTPELADDVCERNGGAAVLEGSIASLGSHYASDHARHCTTGRGLRREQGQAGTKEDRWTC